MLKDVLHYVISNVRCKLAIMDLGLRPAPWPDFLSLVISYSVIYNSVSMAESRVGLYCNYNKY